jgi:spore coat protein U-like protein
LLPATAHRGRQLSYTQRAEPHRTERFTRRALRVASVAIGFFFLALGPLSAVATTVTGSLTVTMTITAGCTITSPTLTFPSTVGTALTAAAVPASTTVSVTCTNGSPYTIGMGQGGNYTTSNRMVSSGNYIPYGLFVDAALTHPWTTGANPTTCTTSNDCSIGTGTGSAQTITIYGNVPIMAVAPTVGTYTDTVVMTVTY